MSELPLYVVIGFLVSTVIFVVPLDGPESFVQYSDNLAHMGRIETMAVDGQYSILNTGYYPLDLPIESCPTPDNRGFYPAAFTLFAAWASICSIIPSPLLRTRRSSPSWRSYILWDRICCIRYCSGKGGASFLQVRSRQ